MINFLKKIKLGELIRYGMVTASSYAVLYAGTYIMVDILSFSPQISYIVMLSLVYIGVYISYTMFVFKRTFDSKILIRFVIALAFIWVLNNSVFYVLDHIFKVHYLIAITFNVLIFGGVRFFIQRFWVFRESDEQAEAKYDENSFDL